MTSYSNLSVKQQKTLQKIQSGEDIVITDADKGVRRERW